MVVLFLWKNKQPGYTTILPTSSTFKRMSRGKVPFFTKHLVTILRISALLFIIIAAARPQYGHGEEKTITEGVDIALCLDVSGSMLAEDFAPNRMEAAKAVVRDFVEEMDGNRIALVAFAGKSLTQCPMTTDFNIIQQLIGELSTEAVTQNGTAIGDALGNAINKFTDEKAKSKLIILLTDGENNTGLDPELAARIAYDKGIRVYTIGVGTTEGAPVPYYQMGQKYYYRQGTQLLKTRLDEEMLQKIASLTQGKYFRATDNTSLRQVYEEIAQLEKHKIETKKYTVYNELYGYFLIPGLLLFVVELLLFTTKQKRLI
jgi:Ca-activated chloride channel family protein